MVIPTDILAGFLAVLVLYGLIKRNTACLPGFFKTFFICRLIDLRSVASLSDAERTTEDACDGSCWSIGMNCSP